MSGLARILSGTSVTKLGPEHAGSVLVAGSHAGIFAACLAAKAGLRAVILNDGGVGLDRAGTAGLDYLDALGLPAATVDHRSARIGDGADMLARGVVSHANAGAMALGVRPGDRSADAARKLAAAPDRRVEAPPYEESRFVLREAPGEPAVWGLDSVSLVTPEDANRILMVGSHGGLLGGDPKTALRGDAIAVVYNDAGGGIDGAGITRLPALDLRAIPAATVDVMTARLGDGRSTWETGVISHVNATAAAVGAKPGMTAKEFADLVVAHGRRS